MKKVQGDRYKRKLVTEEECMNRVEELSQGMMMVYNYTQGVVKPVFRELYNEAEDIFSKWRIFLLDH